MSLQVRVIRRAPGTSPTTTTKPAPTATIAPAVQRVVPAERDRDCCAMASNTSPAATGVPAIELRGATKRFASPTGASFTALRDLNLIVEPGEFCAIVGPTGC